MLVDSVVLSEEDEIEASRSFSFCDASASSLLSSAVTRDWMWSSRSEARVLSVYQLTIWLAHAIEVNSGCIEYLWTRLEGVNKLLGEADGGFAATD